MQPATYAAGVRRPFEDLPPVVTAWVAEQLGGDVTGVRNVTGGFSPGVAAVVTNAAGRSLFVKAVGERVNPDSLAFYRVERDVAARLPQVEGIVRLTAATELEAAGERYVVLVFPALDGSPPRHPWRPTELGRVLGALHRLSGQLTPSPWPHTEGDARLPDFFRCWDHIVADRADPWRTHPWVRPRAAALVAAEEELRGELVGTTLCHTDLRADNIVLSRDQVWFVDWAHAQNAAPWVDAALLLADVVAAQAGIGGPEGDADTGGVDVAAAIRDHPALHGVAFETVWRLMLGLAGALHAFARRPSPPGLPTIRSWQAATSQTWLWWCQRQAPTEF